MITLADLHRLRVSGALIRHCNERWQVIAADRCAGLCSNDRCAGVVRLARPGDEDPDPLWWHVSASTNFTAPAGDTGSLGMGDASTLTGNRTEEQQ